MDLDQEVWRLETGLSQMCGVEGMKLIIDSREPQVWKDAIQRLAKHEGFEVNIQPLKFGDYMTSKAIVERKSIFDLLSSIFDKRYERQQEGICLQADVEDKIPFILIHGSIQEAKEVYDQLNIHGDPYVAIGAISSLVTRMGANVIWVPTDQEAMMVLVKVLKKVEEGKWLQPRRRDPKVLAARLLGITTWQLDDLLDRCGSLVGIGLASEKTLRQVYGIGERKANRIKEVLNTDFRR